MYRTWVSIGGLVVAAVAAAMVGSTVSATATDSERRPSALPPSTIPLPPPPDTGSTPTTKAVAAPRVALDETPAVGALYGACVNDAQADAAQLAIGRGPGPLVAVIGDSITSQIRDELTADPERRWMVWSRCGATTATALNPGVPQIVLGARPEVVVVALGTNDTGFPEPNPGASGAFRTNADAMLRDLEGVACVVWVNAAQVGDPLLQSEIDNVNRDVAAMGHRVHVVDWASAVNANPALLVDRVHLSASGRQARVRLIKDSLQGC